ncbi:MULTISPECIES: hypothetical protein [unclassified Streptomyces]|uniref:hypothetical protein n=1 Tax=unclassified Streptomyces TaxID=2593676 RepID=UPI002E3407B4|nr:MULTISPECIES: hypothetical protein [unclassified Streptomyces]
MADEPVTTPIHDLYAQRFAADLETNRKEQADLTAQIEELEARLRQLKSDENWLCGVQGVLPPAGAVEATVAASPATDATGAVPRPRRAKKSTGGAARAKKDSGAAVPAAEAKAAVRKPAARKPAARKAAARKPDAALPGTRKPAGAEEPPLRELVHALLVQAAEPRMVSEVTADLARAHAGRKASGQVVRNTLEGLVKKGQVEKEHRQGSVMYTAVRPSAQGVVSEAGADAEAGTVPATDTAAATAAP